jgi:cell wall-associated NlpC family hydrolase
VGTISVPSRQEIVKKDIKVVPAAADTKYMSRIKLSALLTLALVGAAAVGTASAAAAHAAPSEVPAAPTTQMYTVKPGDYLKLIATKLQVSLDDLLAANGLTTKSVIHPGDQLIVPPGGVLPNAAAPTPPASGSLYTVKPGDYFKRIAQALGVSIDDLLAVNGMKKTTVIHPGMQLKVPAGATVPPVAADPAGPSAKVTTVLNFVSAQLGEPYKAAGAGPDSWDCSGLTMRAYATVGIALPHYSAAQAKYGQAVEWNTQQIRAGDLIYLATSGTISHVGIATGPTTWIHSPGTGDVVRAGNIPLHRVVAVRRLISGE